MLDRLAEIALGWLGWSEEQALNADMNAILIAFQGRQDMWRFVFGGEGEPEPGNLPAAGPGMFGPKA